MVIPPPTDEELLADSPYRELTERIIGAALAVHSHLGPGLTEAPYQEALHLELQDRGVLVEREVFVPLAYRGRQLRAHYRLDLLVEDTVVVELKAVEQIIPLHRAKLLSCLRGARKPVGLVLNFAAPRMAQGIARVVNDQLLPGPL